MTLARSIALSMSMHIVLFGSGYAFARYAAGPIWREHVRPIMVSLVDGRESAPARADRIPESKVSSERPPARDTGPIQMPQQLNALQQAHETAVHESQNGTTGEGRAEKSSSPDTGGSDGGQAKDAQTATVSPEQWAVIVSAIEQVKSYPRLARERGIEGVVRLRFKVAISGFAEQVEIVESSGYDVLDTASLKSIHQAGPMPRLPGWVEVPMAYVLR